MSTPSNLETLVEQIAAGLTDGATDDTKRQALEACQMAAAIVGAVPGQPLMVPATQPSAALTPPPVPGAVQPPDILDIAIARISAHLTDEERVEFSAGADDVPQLSIPLVQVSK